MKSFLFIIASAFLVISCDMPQCKNTNPVLEKYSPESNEYKKKLAILLLDVLKSGNNDLRYGIDHYEEKNGKRFLYISIQGSKLCAKGEFEVNYSGNLKRFCDSKFLGRYGAEVLGISYITKVENGQIIFVLNDIGPMID
jgi:hypothetical protein